MLIDIAGFTIYALFIEGIMNVCAKLENPLSHADISFSDKVFGE